MRIFNWRLLVVLSLLVSAVGFLLTSNSTAVGSQLECTNEERRVALDLTLLPDCRAYEMVSPPYKEGYPMIVTSFAANGESAVLTSLGALAGGLGSSEAITTGSVYLARRTLAGWRLSSLSAPTSEFVGQRMVAAEASNGETLWIQHAPEQGAFTRDLYSRSSDGQFSLIGPAAPPTGLEEEPSDIEELEPTTFDGVKAATADYGHVVLEARNRHVRWPFDETTGSAESLYEYRGIGNVEPTLVGVEGVRGSRQLIARCGTTLGAGIFGSSYNALSSDGEAIFFTVNPCSSGPATAELYARLRGSSDAVGSAATVDVSSSQCTLACGGESGKNFEGASRDGQLAYFTSTQKLTNDAVDGTAGGDASRGAGCANIAVPASPEVGGCNLYLYEFDRPLGERLRAISVGGEVLGVLGVAEDGSRIYYVSRARIGSTGEGGQPNLYIYDRTKNETTFIATLGSSDRNDWSRAFERPAQVAGPNGRYLLFASSTPGITPDDRTSLTQLFEYRASGEDQGGPEEAAELVRVTKGENGFNEDGNGVRVGVPAATLFENESSLGSGADFKTTVNRLNVSEDGRKIFFVTTGMLSSRATSAENGCRSLYEFDNQGILSQGSIHLVSDGADTSLYRGSFCGTGFQGTDALGNDVLFSSSDPLLAGDVDGGGRDTYDARAGGGFSPSLANSACRLESCESAVITTPLPPVAGSASADGESLISTTNTSGGKKAPKKSPSSKRSRLRRALRMCRGKTRSRRVACEHAARRRFTTGVGVVSTRRESR